MGTRGGKTQHTGRQDWHLLSQGVGALEASRGRVREWKASRAALVPGPMVEPGAQTAMAGQRTWETMVDPWAQDAMVGQGTLGRLWWNWAFGRPWWILDLGRPWRDCFRCCGSRPQPGLNGRSPTTPPPPPPLKSRGSIGHLGALWKSRNLRALRRSGFWRMLSRRGLWRAVWRSGHS